MINNKVIIRNVNENDIPTITQIYNSYIQSSIATFEENAITQKQMQNRIDIIVNQFPFLICEQRPTSTKFTQEQEFESQILGYAYMTNWKDRSAYRFSLESTIYLDNEMIQKGIGSLLYQSLIEMTPKLCHRLIAGISLPNEASVRLHERLGFRKVAHFSEVGKKFGQWIDVGYWSKECK